jgi:hypothetical protein
VDKINLTASNHRSLKAYKNIAGLFTLKGLNIAIGFVMVPLTLIWKSEGLLKPEKAVLM